MASMSYCAVENTANELEQIVEMLETSTISNNEYEEANFDRLVELCQRVVDMTEGSSFQDFTESEEW